MLPPVKIRNNANEVPWWFSDLWVPEHLLPPKIIVVVRGLYLARYLLNLVLKWFGLGQKILLHPSILSAGCINYHMNCSPYL